LNRHCESTVRLMVKATRIRLIKTSTLKCVDPKALSPISRPSFEVIVCPDDSGFKSGLGNRSSEPIIKLDFIFLKSEGLCIFAVGCGHRADSVFIEAQKSWQYHHRQDKPCAQDDAA